MGLEKTFDLKVAMLGHREDLLPSGAFWIEGSAYSPSLPEHLRDIGAPPKSWDYVNDGDAYEEAMARYDLLSAAREPYLLRYHGSARGRDRYSCPVRRDSSLTCDLLSAPPTTGPTHGWPKVEGALPVFPNRAAANEVPHQLPVCTQGTVTVPSHFRKIHSQRFRFGTPEWRRHYGTYRSGISEGAFGRLKYPGGGRVGLQKGAVRVPGITKMTMRVTFFLLRHNVAAELVSPEKRRADWVAIEMASHHYERIDPAQAVRDIVTSVMAEI